MAARANVNYYTIDPRGLVGMTNEFMEMAGGGSPELAGDPPMRTPGTDAAITGVTGGPFNAQTELMAELMMSQGSLRELAEQTGGIASVNTNSLTDAFNRIVEANSRYYVLGYYPPDSPARRPVPQDRSHDKAPGPARRWRAEAMDRRAAGPPKSGSATKRRNALTRGTAPERRQDIDCSCAKSSPARCSRAG